MAVLLQHAEIQGLRPDRAARHGTNQPDDEPKPVGFSVGPNHRSKRASLSAHIRRCLPAFRSAFSGSILRLRLFS